MQNNGVIVISSFYFADVHCTMHRPMALQSQAVIGQYSGDHFYKTETKSSLKPVVDKQFGKGKFQAKNVMTQATEQSERADSGREFLNLGPAKTKLLISSCPTTRKIRR